MTVLEGSRLSIEWHVTPSLKHKDILWCYFRRRPNELVSWTKFVGWNPHSRYVDSRFKSLANVCIVMYRPPWCPSAIACLQSFIHIPRIYDEPTNSVPFCNSRLNISTIGHVGWEFLTPEPCISGIKRQNVTPDYSGIYDLTLKDNQQREDEQVTYVTVIQGKYMEHTLMVCKQ